MEPLVIQKTHSSRNFFRKPIWKRRKIFISLDNFASILYKNVPVKKENMAENDTVSDSRFLLRTPERLYIEQICPQTYFGGLKSQTTGSRKRGLIDLYLVFVYKNHLEPVFLINRLKMPGNSPTDKDDLRNALARGLTANKILRAIGDSLTSLRKKRGKNLMVGTRPAWRPRVLETALNPMNGSSSSPVR